jgi:alpha-L-arabinofuranosidase
MNSRRQFLRSAATTTAALTLSRFSGLVTSAAESKIEILLNETQGTISPNIYSHFTEHLGAVIYDGIWVGADSKVPNVSGIRRDLVEHLKKIKAPVIRYPGGCFADSYDWRDGIGPADQRPRRTNFWSFSRQSPAIHRYEPNIFGTDEFMRFCKLSGAEPYLAANVRSLPAEAFYRWVEYCNSPKGSTSLAGMRAAAGSPDPYNVHYWGVGNESWGCGGNFTPQEYSAEFRRFTAWVPGFGQQLNFIASGPNGDDLNWTRGFFESIRHKDEGLFGSIYGWGLHYYAWNVSMGRTTDWDKGKGDAVQFSIGEWYELLHEGLRVEPMIDSHWQAMGEFDKQHRVKLIVDEWGPWYRPGSEATPGNLLQQMPTLRDAVFSAMTLDLLNRHANQVAMGNCAQLINCLNSLYLAHEDRFVITPVGYVFDLYSGHQGAQSLRAVFSAPDLSYDRNGKPTSLPGLMGSASVRGKDLLLTVVNPDVTQVRETQISLGSSAVASASACILTSTDIHAHNTFAQPNAVTPQLRDISASGSVFTHIFPPASVTALALRLH